MYIKHCKLSAKEQLKLMEFFVAGTTARTASEWVGIHRNSAVRFFHKLREKIALKQQNRAEQFHGKIELDESYFGGVRKGKMGTRRSRKGSGFRAFEKRRKNIYAQVINDAQKTTLTPIVREKVTPDSVVYTDSFKARNVLDVSEFKHYRINHSKQFADKHNHINGIENFWNQAKRHLRKFNGIQKERFYLFLKECERRFNTGNPSMLLKDLKKLLKELY